MSMTLHSARIPLRNLCASLAVTAALAVAATACGGVQRQVDVPGAAPATAPAAPVDPKVATPGGVATTEPAEVPAEDPSNSTTPSPPSSGPALVPGSTAAPSTEPSPESSVDGSSVGGSSSAGAPLNETPTVTGWAAFDLHLTTILESGSRAVSATVLRDGEVVHEVALGDRTEAGDPVEVGDRYRIASISKVVTAVTVLRLVERGAIGLDDPVGARLAARVGVTDPASGVGQIALRHLLTHRSGIAQYEDLMFRRQVESCDQAAAVGLGRGLERAPGTTFRYSNLNLCLVGLLIEDLTARPYEDVVRDELLAPLGVDGMRLAGTFDVRDGEVEHRSDDGRNYMEVLAGAGSWIASPTEVATIIDSLDLSTPGWKPLGADTMAQMRAITEDPPLTPEQAATTSTTLEPPPPRTTGYGMALMIFGPDAFGHTGTVESTHAMTVRQADGVTWAITVSGDHPSSTRDLAGIVAEALRDAGPV
ncbi:MAG: serine hydrolase domain-containing protein [Ilumatobacter sp.]|uniref:serine hydrolase domain-containing protein n=1 Tax=Ilumatobacter sp. TaxID=1967498 RepID=UPI003299258B